MTDPLAAGAAPSSHPVTGVERGRDDLAIPHISRIREPYRPIIEVDLDYSRLPIGQGFNWEEAFAAVESGEWYLVAFRSKHRADADHAYLTWLDERASSAASRHSGFMDYFIGTPRTDGSCTRVPGLIQGSCPRAPGVSRMWWSALVARVIVKGGTRSWRRRP